MVLSCHRRGLEVFWSTCLKFSEGFTVLKFTILTVIGMIFSFVFLSQATKVLPLGTSYAIWTASEPWAL